MKTAERINETLRRLPGVFQQEVLDFVEFLTEKNAKRENGAEPDAALRKAEFIDRWAKQHSPDTPVILDDRREIIYED